MFNILFWVILFYCTLLVFLHPAPLGEGGLEETERGPFNFEYYYIIRVPYIIYINQEHLKNNVL